MAKGNVYIVEDDDILVSGCFRLSGKEVAKSILISVIIGIFTLGIFLVIPRGKGKTFEMSIGRNRLVLFVGRKVTEITRDQVQKLEIISENRKDFDIKLTMLDGQVFNMIAGPSYEAFSLEQIKEAITKF